MSLTSRKLIAAVVGLVAIVTVAVVNAWQPHSQISFQYRLYRRRIVVVTVTDPRIYHRKLRGNGSKGFILEGRVLSIDGMLPAYGRVGEFALNRIVGQHPLRLLVQGSEEY